MRFSLLSQALCGATLVVGLPKLSRGVDDGFVGLEKKAGAKALAPLLAISGMDHKLVPLQQAVQDFANAPKAHSDPATYNDTASPEELAKTNGGFMTESVSAAASCASSPNIRYEWDDYSTSDRQALMSAFKCLMNKPASGAFTASTSRWEDFARLHQLYTPNVHQNQKFLPWHRYFIWVFEQVLRDECGFDRAFFWFDETKHSGAFSGSDAFSAPYLGTLGATSHCGKYFLNPVWFPTLVKQLQAMHNMTMADFKRHSDRWRVRRTDHKYRPRQRQHPSLSEPARQLGRHCAVQYSIRQLLPVK